MRVLVFDNYDSFTYNLVHIIRELGFGDKLEVYRNDKIPLEEIRHFDKILLSPGPGVPSEAGILLPLIQHYASTHDILGVCLGHQAIAEAFGGQLFNMPEVLHGVAEPIRVMDPGELLFKDIPGQFQACRYHSWSVEREGLPPALLITAEDEKGRIMGLRHREYRIRGVQFHPESIMTEYGKQMIYNWLKS
jgi:anthranilate synthase component 2